MLPMLERRCRCGSGWLGWMEAGWLQQLAAVVDGDDMGLAPAGIGLSVPRLGPVMQVHLGCGWHGKQNGVDGSWHGR